jgi:hypothetical protein
MLPWNHLMSSCDDEELSVQNPGYWLWWLLDASSNRESEWDFPLVDDESSFCTTEVSFTYYLTITCWRLLGFLSRLMNFANWCQYFTWQCSTHSDGNWNFGCWRSSSLLGNNMWWPESANLTNRQSWRIFLITVYTQMNTISLYKVYFALMLVLFDFQQKGSFLPLLRFMAGMFNILRQTQVFPQVKIECTARTTILPVAHKSHLWTTWPTSHWEVWCAAHVIILSLKWFPFSPIQDQCRGLPVYRWRSQSSPR